MFKTPRSTRIVWLAALTIVLAVQTVPLHAQPAPTAWPMWGQNAQRTGESFFPGPQGPAPILQWTAGTYGCDGIVIGPTALYFNDQGRGLRAVHFDGTPKWLWRAPSTGVPAVGANGRLYVPTYDSGLYAIDPEGTVNPDGTLDASAIKWNIPGATFGNFVTSPLLIDNDGSIFAITQLLWKIEDADDHPEYVWPAVAGDGGDCRMALDDNGTPDDTTDDLVFVERGDYSLCAVKSLDGTTLWTRKFKSTVNSPTVGNDGTVYVTTNDFILWALNPDTGATRWQATIGKKKGINGFCPAVPSVDNSVGTVYCAGMDSFYAFNKGTGQVKWKKSFPATGSNPSGSKPAIGSDGTVYWCSGLLYAISAANGATLWSIAGHGTNDPVIDWDGTLYVGSGNGVSAYHDP